MSNDTDDTPEDRDLVADEVARLDRTVGRGRWLDQRHLTVDPKDVTFTIDGQVIPSTAELRAERDRLAERLASAIARNESLIEQREDISAAWHLCRSEVAYGHALLHLVRQLRRLRRAVDGGRVPFKMDREDQADAARAEIEESILEIPGSDAEAHEIIDALGAVLQMFIGAGHGDAALLVKLAAGGSRLEERLDLVDCGMTWAQAKMVQRCEHPRMPAALVRLLDAASEPARRQAINVVMGLAREWQERDQ